MPATRYLSNDRLTDRAIIEAVVEGRYLVDLETGEVKSGRTNKPLFTYASERSPNLWVRVYVGGKMRALPVARFVWIVGTDSELPDGWEVHHVDLDPLNNSFNNLLALHPKDHDRFHINTQQRLMANPASEVPF